MESDTHLAFDSSEDERFHDELRLRNTSPLKGTLLLVGFLTHKMDNIQDFNHFIFMPKLFW